MKMEELTPHVEELKRVIGEEVSEDKLIEELNIYLNVYHVSLDAAKRGIMRKYGKDTGFVSAMSIVKKISEMDGTEQNVDLKAKVVFVEKKDIVVKGAPKSILSGILGDETSTASFTLWDTERFELEKGSTYMFRNAYTKTWNDKVQINFGSRSVAEKTDNDIELPDRQISYSSSEAKISELREGMGNVTITGKILTLETKNIESKGEKKIVFSGLIADNTGKVQYSAWKDFELTEGESICAKNAYVRSWRGIPQLNFGDRCEISKVDSDFESISADLQNPRDISEIIKTGGGLDIVVTGTIVDIRTGSGIIKRCPECNRSIMGDECASHGKVVPVQDLRMKIVIDDGTGALTAIVNRECTESLTGITLTKAVDLAKATGDQDSVFRSIETEVLMKYVTASGNVLSDEYGPMMIVRKVDGANIDVHAEAEKLMKKLEVSL